MGSKEEKRSGEKGMKIKRKDKTRNNVERITV